SHLLLPASSTLFPYTTLFRSRRHPRQPRASPAETRRTSAARRRATPCARRWPSSSARLLDREDLPVGDLNLDRFVGTRERLAERSEEHTSELQSRFDLVCRLL